MERFPCSEALLCLLDRCWTDPTPHQSMSVDPSSISQCTSMPAHNEKPPTEIEGLDMHQDSFGMLRIIHILVALSSICTMRLLMLPLRNRERVHPTDP